VARGKEIGQMVKIQITWYSCHQKFLALNVNFPTYQRAEKIETTIKERILSCAYQDWLFQNFGFVNDVFLTI
jgi:hypothetical protein